MPVGKLKYLRSHELKFQKVVLNNGLTVCWEQLDHLRSCSLAVIVNTGARDETEKSWGYSHFIEHMLFKGTAKKTPYEIASALEKKGGYLNAMTGSENTWVEARFIDHQLPEVMELIGDMLSDSLLEKKSIEDEKEVVRQEIKSSFDSPDDMVFDLFFKDIFGKHPLGRSVLGSYESVKAITRPKLLKYYRQNYSNTNTYIGLVGNIYGDITSLVKKYFNLSSNKKNVRAEFKKSYIGYKTHRKTLAKQINFIIGGVAPNASSPDRYRFQILMNHLGGGLSSRFFQLLREVNPLVYNVSSFYYPYSDVGIGGLYISVSADNLKKVEKLVENEIKIIMENGFTKDEIEFSKEQMKGNIILGLESSKSRVSKLLNDQIYRGRWISMEETESEISKVTDQDVNVEAFKFFSDKNIMRTYLKPKAR
ncbi:insulinase family protein [candidate division WOR-3 bacterium]|nr:insulinase family protein [candidate division WOR-3 bacterium]